MSPASARMTFLAALVVALAGCSDSTGPGLDARFDTTACASSLSGGTLGNVKVIAGQDCSLEGVNVQGNVVVPEGGSLVLVGGHVDGNIQADRPAWFEVTGTTLDGNIQVEHGVVVRIVETTLNGNIQVKKMTGPGEVNILIADNLVLEGDIQVEENRVAGLSIEGNTVSKGNLQVFKNTGAGAKVVSGNAVAQNLQCKENTSPFTATLNVAGSSEGQCVHMIERKTSGEGS